VLAVASDEWRAAGELDDGSDASGIVGIDAEITAHVCIVCSAVVSVSVNIDHQPKAGLL